MRRKRRQVCDRLARSLGNSGPVLWRLKDQIDRHGMRQWQEIA
jgi:hypothetical protein